MKRRIALTVSLVAWSWLVAAAPAEVKEISVTSKSAEAIEVFKQGRDLMENIRPVEAAQQFQKAVALDADFALAHAYLGMATPGGEGLRHLEHASDLAQKLPEAERTFIAMTLAERRGDEQQARALLQKLLGSAPGDWRVQIAHGGQLSDERKWDESIAALKKAIELNPNAGSAYNTMGYAYLATGQHEQAIAAFRKYASINMKEPNPQDSLAEALMAAGRFAEAETAFRKAVEISPQFHIAWAGVAQAKFLRGDWVGGREALLQARKAASRPLDQLEVDGMLAWSHAAEGNLAEALKVIDKIEKEAAVKKVDVIQAFTPLERAALLNEMGKHEEALELVSTALDGAAKYGLPGGAMNDLRRTALVVRIQAESKLGRATEAKSTLALLEAEVKKAPANADLKSMAHFARGAEALAHGDARAAVQHFAQCDEQDYYCRMQLVTTQDKAGDKAGAESTRKELIQENRREPMYLYVRSKLVGGTVAAKQP